MFLLIITYGFVIVAGPVIYFILRDKKNPGLFFERHSYLALTITAILGLGIITAFYSTLAEPFILRTNRTIIHARTINRAIRIAFVSDIQIGNHKKEAWAEKIASKIEVIAPDVVIFGGDQIDNEGTFEDESVYLQPLQRLSEKYPVYYILGNHEYGIGGTVRLKPEKYTGDRSEMLINRLNSYGFVLLRNSLECPEIKQQKICLFGLDDIWKYPPEFSQLKNLDKSIPLFLITHNPDGVLFYPENLPVPDLVLAGHTHGGQIWIPFWGPLGSAQTFLGKSYYRGLNYYRNIPIFTSVGAGESGAPLRLLAVPEIALIEILPE